MVRCALALRARCYRLGSQETFALAVAEMEEVMSTELKFCCDCKWAYVTEASEKDGNHRCGHPEAPVSLVTGRPTQHCEEMRRTSYAYISSTGLPSWHCGPKGKGWRKAKDGNQVQAER